MASEKGGEGRGSSELLLAMWAAICFIGLLVLLKLFVFGPVGKALEERENKIKDAVEGAEKAKTDAQALIAEHKKQLGQASAESQAIVNEAREAAEDVRKDMLEKAGSEADGVVKRARAEIEQEKEKSLDELRKTVADLSVEVATKAVGKALDASDHQRLVDEFISNISKTD